MRKLLLLFLVLAGYVSAVFGAGARERILLNREWRFTKNDPTNESGNLSYDLRPEVKDRQDDKAADSEPTEAESVHTTNKQILKPWILPTGNSFILDPSNHYVRPGQEVATNMAYTLAAFDDRSWGQIDLPHDWAISGPFDVSGRLVGGGMGRLPSPGVGWYRRKLDIPANDAGKSIFLEVGGAMSYAMVWLNGHLVGGWPYGYASWRVNLTPYIIPGGTNQLAIRLDNPPDSSRWYPGGGIYRNVWLVKTGTIHVGQWGTYITTPDVSKDRASVRMQVTVDNDSRLPGEIQVETGIYSLDAKGKRGEISLARIAPQTLTIQPNRNGVLQGETILNNPKRWGPPPTQQPNLYLAITTITQAGKIIDQYETRFGVRAVQFDPNQGIIVNGERIRLQGVNQHHDLGALGAAFNVQAARRQLEILRELGCNAVRMSHNPPAAELLELTDEMGFLVIDEIFDVWERKKTPLDFHLIFPEWHEQDLRAFLRRDRNHPSVFLWSIGNEVGEQYTGVDGAKVAQALCNIAHAEDSTRPTTTAMNFAKPDMPLPAVVDVIGLNYQGEGIRDTPAHAELQGIHTPPQYPDFHQTFPNKVIVSTETAAALSSRGEYLFPVFEGISAPVKNGHGGDSKLHQVSAYELYAADFGSAADKVFAAQDRHPYVAGEFGWSGWDYLGEPTPYYSSRSSYFGIIDLAGLKKNRFYLYQSRWRPELPMAHILPHWNWPERVGLVTPVHVFTSGDEAELFLNGQSLGRQKKGDYEYRLRWDDVVYQPGRLEVVAYKKGVKWAVAEQSTAGAPAKLKLEVDRNTITPDGLDLAFISVTITDENGIMTPRSDKRINFKIDGPGEIVATDNGDPTSFESFQSHQRKAFNGRCLVIVRGKPSKPGEFKVVALGDGLDAGITTIQSKVHAQ